MNGKLVGGFLVTLAVIAGAAVYYTQVYAYYEPVAASGEIRLTAVDGRVEPMPVDGFEGIDAESSPLRYRACFRVPVSLATMTESYTIAEDAVPLNGPGWFSCYDAAAIGAALESGEAVAFLGEREVHPGVDRIIAITRDGQGFAWHQLNENAEN